MAEAGSGEKTIVTACACVRAGLKSPAGKRGAGGPAKGLRDLSEDEIAWKRDGTGTYQELARRSLASLVEVAPLAAMEADRPRIPASDVKPLIATRRGE